MQSEISSNNANEGEIKRIRKQIDELGEQHKIALQKRSELEQENALRQARIDMYTKSLYDLADYLQINVKSFGTEETVTAIKEGIFKLVETLKNTQMKENKELEKEIEVLKQQLADMNYQKQSIGKQMEEINRQLQGQLGELQTKYEGLTQDYKTKMSEQLQTNSVLNKNYNEALSKVKEQDNTIERLRRLFLLERSNKAELQEEIKNLQAIQAERQKLLDQTKAKLKSTEVYATLLNKEVNSLIMTNRQFTEDNLALRKMMLNYIMAVDDVVKLILPDTAKNLYELLNKQFPLNLLENLVQYIYKSIMMFIVLTLHIKSLAVMDKQVQLYSTTLQSCLSSKLQATMDVISKNYGSVADVKIATDDSNISMGACIDSPLIEKYQKTIEVMSGFATNIVKIEGFQGFISEEYNLPKELIIFKHQVTSYNHGQGGDILVNICNEIKAKSIQAISNTMLNLERSNKEYGNELTLSMMSAVKKVVETAKFEFDQTTIGQDIYLSCNIPEFEMTEDGFEVSFKTDSRVLSLETILPTFRRTMFVNENAAFNTFKSSVQKMMKYIDDNTNAFVKVISNNAGISSTIDKYKFYWSCASLYSFINSGQYFSTGVVRWTESIQHEAYQVQPFAPYLTMKNNYSSLRYILNTATNINMGEGVQIITDKLQQYINEDPNLLTPEIIRDERVDMVKMIDSLITCVTIYEEALVQTKNDFINYIGAYNENFHSGVYGDFKPEIPLQYGMVSMVITEAINKKEINKIMFILGVIINMMYSGSFPAADVYQAISLVKSANILTPDQEDKIKSAIVDKFIYITMIEPESPIAQAIENSAVVQVIPTMKESIAKARDDNAWISALNQRGSS